MSLGVVIKGPEGIVLAADSRITLEAQKPGQPPPPLLIVNFDNATKLLRFSGIHKYVGAVTYGAAVIGLRTAHSFIPEFELTLPEKRLSVEDYANCMSDFYLKTWKDAQPAMPSGPSMMFIVGGYNQKEPYGRVFLFDIPNNPKPIPRNPGETDYGITWGGQLNISSRIIHGFDPALPAILEKSLNLDKPKTDQIVQLLKQNLEFHIPYQVLPLQDCIDLALFLIKTTIIAQGLAIGVRGVGGPIDIAVITRTEGIDFIQSKALHGEDKLD